MKKLLCGLLVLMCAACIAFSAVASDSEALVQPMFGDVNDFGGGDGGGDWGGGNDDYGGGYTYYGDDGGSSSGGDGTLGPVEIVVGVIVIIIILAVVGTKGRGKGTPGGSGQVVNGNSRQGMNVNLPDRTAEIERIIKLSDPNFSADDFMSFTKNVFVDINNAWCKRDLSGVRPVFHENLYNQSVAQIEMKIANGEVVHVDRIAVNTAYPTGYKMDSQFEYITVYLAAQMIEWHEDEKTGNILRGDKTTRWSLRYKMKFMRSVGVQTKTETGEESGHNCPNCGAPLEISSTGKCLYCNSVVTTGQYNWVLSEFGGVKNDTVDDGIVIPQEIRDKLNNNNGGSNGGTQG